MIRSMTGFGKASEDLPNGKITIEIKTVNHKFFDATLKLPNGIAYFEDRIKEALQKRIKRGKVNLNLILDGALLKEEKIVINKKAARNYYDDLLLLRKSLGLKEEIAIRDVIALPGVLNYKAIDENIAKAWPKIKKTLNAAVDRLISDREKEGRALCADLLKRAGKISKMLGVIKSRAHLNIDEYRKRFTERIQDLTGGRPIDVGRLEMEVAIYAKNCDISEEITRLRNHLSNFTKTIGGSGEVGKKLDFIAQELHRETNTIGSKASDFKISKNVIEIKGEIEKIREQAKNIE
jgi:uncharacterized protein (TIGR00255 family)